MYATIHMNSTCICAYYSLNCKYGFFSNNISLSGQLNKSRYFYSYFYVVGCLSIGIFIACYICIVEILFHIVHNYFSICSLFATYVRITFAYNYAVSVIIEYICIHMDFLKTWPLKTSDPEIL